MTNIVELPFKPVSLYGFKEGVGVLLAQWNIAPELRETLIEDVLTDIKESTDYVLIQGSLFNKETFDYYRML